MTFDIVGVEQKLPDNTVNPPVWKKTAIKAGDYAPGVPLPVNSGNPNSDFWLTSESSPIGGKLGGVPGGVQFGIPNLVYDYKTPYSNDGYTDQNAQIFKIMMANPQVQTIGLYSQDQLARFRGTLSSNMSIDALFNNVTRVRAPTLYETSNYMVPVPFEDFAKSGEGAGEGILGHFGQIITKGQPMDGGVRRYINYIYAPLFGNDHEEILYKTGPEVVSTIADFMREQQTGINKYRDAMNDAARNVKSQESMASKAAGADYGAAASGISDIWNTAGAEVGPNPQTCRSLSGFFIHFYWGGPVGAPPGSALPTDYVDPGGDTTKNVKCPEPIGKLLESYFSPTTAGSSDFSPTHYKMEYAWNPAPFGGDGQKALSAYMPGPFTGVDNNGLFSNLAGLTESTRRNFYSTKFVQLNSLKGTGGYSEAGGTNKVFSIHSEGGVTALPEAKQDEYRNPLVPIEDTSSIRH